MVHNICIHIHNQVAFSWIHDTFQLVDTCNHIVYMWLLQTVSERFRAKIMDRSPERKLSTWRTDGDFGHEGQDTEIAQTRLSEPTDMTRHWKALEDNFLMVTISFSIQTFLGKSFFRNFSWLEIVEIEDQCPCSKRDQSSVRPLLLGLLRCVAGCEHKMAKPDMTCKSLEPKIICSKIFTFQYFCKWHF
jgi:hypothetical protein